MTAPASTTTTSTTGTSTTRTDADPADTHDCGGCLDRRQLLQRAGGAGLAVAGVAVLAACGSSSGSSGGDGGATPAADGSLAAVADVPVGGALLVDDNGTKILLVQATEGTITALSAICTHQGCTVAPDGEQLHCPCHNSVFGLDGSNVSGPAPEPLPAVDVHVQDGAVFSGAA